MDTVAEILAASLVKVGIQRIFGIPGGANVAIVEAIRKQRIHFELTTDENSAVFMASASARLTGQPGVCLTTLGPGAANATLGTGHAYLDRAPVVIITAQLPDSLRPQHTHQYLDLHALFHPITKASWDVTPENAQGVIQSAFQVARTGRPGPVHLQLTNENAVRPTKDRAPKDLSMSEPEKSSTHHPQYVAHALHLLEKAQRPLIVAGLGLEPRRPYSQLHALAENWDAPVIVTPKAKGALPEDHPLFAGTIGLTKTDPVYEILQEADCVLAVGLDVVELVRPWETSADLVWIAAWENLDPQIPAEFELVGDLGPILEELTPGETPSAGAWGRARVASFREKAKSHSLPKPQAGRLLPQTVLEVLEDATPLDRVITSDVGSHKILASLEWPVMTPNRFMVSNGLSCMGFGLAAAHAASLVLPETQIICLIGDTGLNMSAGGLAPIAHFHGRVMVVVFNDGALDLIRSHQIRGGAKPYGTTFYGPDVAKLGEAYGLHAFRADDHSSLREAVEEAVRGEKPALIDVAIDPMSYPTTP